ncbi:hypothetical protein ACI6QG_02085 [Roseococcus sp. DSY-14]|uniref:hypothetical protein n=1 Tax=Roseococcus sp. DSY-14 TaxID=3369650 RepID=UPI00387AC8C0
MTPSFTRAHDGAAGLALCFMVLSALSLLAGSCMGIWMGVAHDFVFAPVHAHLNLLGWASMALFGLAYRAWPAMAEAPLARMHLAVSGAGAFVLPLGIALAVAGAPPAVAILGALLWTAGAALFLGGLLRLVAAPAGSATTVPAE